VAGIAGLGSRTYCTTRRAEIRDRGGAGRSEYGEIQAHDGTCDIEGAGSRLSKANIELSRTEIRAPMDGVVIRRNIARGQIVASSLQAPILFTMVENLSSIEVEVAVDEADIGKIKIEQFVIFAVDAYPNESFMGRVRQIRIAPEQLQGVITYIVVVGADNPKERLLPGMTGLVRIAVRQSDATLVSPNSALRFEPPEQLKPAGWEGAGDEPILWKADGIGGGIRWMCVLEFVTRG
jgi:HlyD family secretion protein